MEKIIAFCGIDCSECKAFVATKEDSDIKRTEVAKEWTKEFGHEIKPEEINCVGCLDMNGPHINYCGMCEIRSCGTKKEIKNCAYCVDYKCEKLEKFHEQAPIPKERLEKIREQVSKKKSSKKK